MKTIFSDDAFQEGWLKFYELETKGLEVNNYYNYFYSVVKSFWLAEIKEKKLIAEDIPPMEYTEYRLALENFLQNDDIYTKIIDLYLILPNETAIAKQLNITRVAVRKLLENAKNRIGFEYLKIRNTDHLNCDSMV